MNCRGKVVLIIFVACALFGGPAGCWNRNEPESLASILSIGLDYDAEGGEYEVLVEVANPWALAGGQAGGDSSGGGGSGSARPSLVLSARGRTIFEALRRIETMTPRQLFWAHTEVVVISESLARQGLEPALDFFTRERQSRLVAVPLITDSDVKALLDAEIPLEQVSGEALLSQLQTTERTDAVVPTTDLRLLFMSLSEPGIDPFLPRATLVQRRQDEQQGGQQDEQQGEGQQEGRQPQGGRGGTHSTDIIELNGGAAFRGDRLAGWLNNSATRGWFWITGEAFRGTVVMPFSDENGEKYMTVEIFQSYSSIKPAVVRGKPRIKIDITVEGRIQELTGASKRLSSMASSRSLDKILAGAIRDDVYAALGRARELGTDIFGFGRSFYRTMPQQWPRYAANWEEVFKELEVDVTITARVRRIGLSKEPLQQIR